MEYKDKKILKNMLQCNNCKDIIESKHRHDFKWCKCGNIAVYGGKEYLRRCVGIYDYTDMSVYEGD